jgi:pyruvate formate lyase activating enzyme
MGSTADIALISNIQKFCIHDGPGIRTTIFFKGCPLHCLWCHNVESISPFPEIMFFENKCIGCNRCRHVCKKNAITEDFPQKINRTLCNNCGECAQVCPGGALQLSGTEMHITELIDIVLRDAIFYKNSGGGATLSGGEPFFQFPFIEQLLQELKKRGINTCIETSGFVTGEKLKRILPLTDTLIFDIKQTDPLKHQKYTGVDNTIIMENLTEIAQSDCNLWLRLPLVPGYTDDAKNIKGIASIIRSLNNEKVKLHFEVMPYHNLGIAKYKALDKECLVDKVPTVNQNKASEIYNSYFAPLIR